jgi:Fic family protein
MLHHGYWLCEFISISHVIKKAHAQYSRAFLYTETDDNDLTYFILYHVEVLRKALTALEEYVDRKTNELRSLETQFQTTVLLNSRQRALISHALRHAGFLYTTYGHQNSHGVSYQTARNDLTDLRDKGLLETKTSGKTTYFRPVEDLKDRLEELE